MKKNFLILIGLAFGAAGLYGETGAGVALTYSGSSGYSLVERTNLRRYQNGKYVGLTSREVRSFISPSRAPSRKFAAKGSVFEHDKWYDGSFYVMEETLRNTQSAGAGVHDSIPSMFHISPDGKLTMFKDNGYPSFRSFPAYTTDEVKPGDSWKAYAERSVDPMNKGVFTKMQMLVAYTFCGAEVYRGSDVYRIKAMWQTNYGGADRDPAGDGSLVKAAGGHKADIIVLQSTGVPILVIDQVDETFAWVDGTQINFKGTISLFTEFPPAYDSEKIKSAVAKLGGTNVTAGAEVAAGGSLIPGEGVTPGAVSGADAAGAEVAGGSSLTPGVVGGAGAAAAGAAGAGVDAGVVTGPSIDSGASSSSKIVTEETEAGLRLSIRDIKFAPDSDEVLPSEKTLLDEIASVLKLAPKGQFLVEGHTASTGRPAGEQKLSEQRAHRIAEELASRGVDAGAFICRGWGGNRPVASNETEAGRAQNRRVEITILK